MTESSCEGRFVVTFDDGPHANTSSTLEQLAYNPVQQGNKAMFFLQTGNAEVGGPRLGHSLLQGEHTEGHVLGLHTIRRRMQLRDLPAVAGIALAIVTFHDTDYYTTGNLTKYLDLLLDESKRVGLRLDKKPFYDNTAEIMRAALCRAVRRTDTAEAKAQPAEPLLCQHK